MGIDVGTGEPTRLGAGAGAAGSPSGRPNRAWFSPAAWLVAAVPGVLGLITGGYYVGRPPIWGDEGVTKAMAARSVSQLLATMPHDDIVHGAYYLLVHAVETVAGSPAPTVAS